jgi:CRISPR-associated endonuclease/helicase Cas3
MAEILGLEWAEARAWLLFVIACHDLGKACPEFQDKWPVLLPSLGLKLPRSPKTGINHAYVSQIALKNFLCENSWPEDLAELAADAIGCHHGERISPTTLANLEGHVCPNTRDPWKNDWAQARKYLADALLGVFQPVISPGKNNLTGPDFMLLSGLTSFADWIGSNEEWFPFGSPDDCGNLQEWFEKRRGCAEQALNVIGWQVRIPLVTQAKTFEQVFNFPPRPLQEAIAVALASLKKPAILLVEAPMGEGKTEAAFFAHIELQRRFGHRGLYVALPTKATGNAMFKRTLEFLQKQGVNRTLDLQLLHGATLLNDTFQNLHLSGIYDPATGGEIRASEWFTQKKRALLSEYGVGTVDQALLPILPVRHHFVRLWGLANRVVIFDEIHAYDAYTGTLLVYLLRWLISLGSSVVLLSATLSPSIRRKLADAVETTMPEIEEAYPRLTVFSPGVKVQQTHFAADPNRRLTLQIKSISAELSDMLAALTKHLFAGGMGLALVNTVQRAQDLYGLFPEGEIIVREGQRVGKRLHDGTEVFLFHARFPADRRQQREEQALELFGETGARTGRKILIATQVAEQSLDLDFDLIVTDLAPIDLLLQRAGRLWRHAKNHLSRKVAVPTLFIAGLSGDEPPSFGKPLWWGAVYREDLLLRTWCLLRTKDELTLPDEIDPLVQAVYEENVEVPDSLQAWLDKALLDGEGKAYAQKIQADQAILGLPDDESWNQPERFVLYDEDAPGIHRTLMARTRLGENSVVVVPLWLEDGFSPEVMPASVLTKSWFLRALSLSRKGVVRELNTLGVPEGWKKSSLLCNCIPLMLDAQGRWVEDASVRLDDDLGLVYETKGAK